MGLHSKTGCQLPPTDGHSPYFPLAPPLPFLCRYERTTKQNEGHSWGPTIEPFSHDVRDIQSWKIWGKMAKMLMKASENELKTMFVIKFNAQSLNIHKTTLHPGKPSSRGFKVTWRTWHCTNYTIPVIFCFLRFLWVFREPIINYWVFSNASRWSFKATWTIQVISSFSGKNW